MADPSQSDTGDNAGQSGLAAAKPSKPLSPKAGELLQDRASGLPVWIRSPKKGTEFYSGFSRSKLYEAAGKGYIRSVSIREPGQVKGTRLFHLQSILDFIDRCEQAAKAQPKSRRSGPANARPLAMSQ